MPIVVYRSDPSTFRRIWLPFAAWGLALVLFGLFMIASPRLTGRLIVLAAGLLLLAAGVTQLASAVVAGRRITGLAWLPVVTGVIALGLGVFALTQPETVARLFALVGGLAALAWGATDVAIGLTGRSYIRTWAIHALRGVLSMGVGVLLIARPLEALIGIAWLVGLWAVVIGAITLGLALEARSV
ncbi:MAG: hypothetical protein Kow0056_05980 [Coriobacteriia bacterium]